MRQDTPQLGDTYVRVTGTLRERFVEFDFILNDETLSIELVMPYPEFRAFCEKYESSLLPMDEEVSRALAVVKSRAETRGRQGMH